MARLVQAAVMATLVVGMAACCSTAPKETAAKEDKYDGEGFNLKSWIGSTKNPPDEFAVLTKRPLEMPKDFAALPPPQPGARSSREVDPVAEARAALLGESSAQPANVRTSASEAALLSAAGAQTDPNIRTALAAEQEEYEAKQGEYLLDRYIPSLRAWRGEDAKNIVDPIEERQRLSTATAASRAARQTEIATIPDAATSVPITTTATPVPAAPAAVPAVPAPVTDGELIYIPE